MLLQSNEVGEFEEEAGIFGFGIAHQLEVSPVPKAEVDAAAGGQLVGYEGIGGELIRLQIILGKKPAPEFTAEVVAHPQQIEPPHLLKLTIAVKVLDVVQPPTQSELSPQLGG